MNDSGTELLPALRRLPEPKSKSLSGSPQPIVLVLGMHRSGTSLCSHVLNALGVDMTDDMTSRSGTIAADNPKGHWERWEIVDFHDRILGIFNRQYSSVLHDFCLPTAWWADPRVVSIRRGIIRYVESRMDNALFGFKDPRTVRLMPMWYRIFAELNVLPKIVYCLRNPVQVARSLHARDGITPELAEYRWLSYNIDFFRYLRKHEFCTIEYEAWFADSNENLNKLRAFLNLPNYYPDGAELERAVSQIVDHTLQHDDPSKQEARQPLIRSMYRLARCAEKELETRDKLHSVVADFHVFQQLQAAFAIEFENNAALAARLPGIEHEAMTLRAAINERDKQITALEIENSVSRATLVARERVADEAQQAHELARVEVAIRDKRLAELEVALAESTASVERALTDVRDAAEKAERAEQRARALEMTRDQLSESRNLVAQIESDAHHRIGYLQRSLRQAEGELCEAKEAARTARQVAQTAVRALAENKAGLSYSRPRLGWRHAIRRMFGICAARDSPCRLSDS